ncbi:MAG: sigma factor-like helix-turn-helix DNA-binding protein [Methylococcaceae bacterium]
MPFLHKNLVKNFLFFIRCFFKKLCFPCNLYRIHYFNQQGGWAVDLSNWSKPEKAMEQEEFMLVLQECISRLPTRMAQLFVLREFDNINSEDICELMSISTLNNFG